MTLAERLSREAAPCLKGTHAANVPFKSCLEKPWVFPDLCAGCHYRPAIQAAIEKAIEVCAEIADDVDPTCDACEQSRARICAVHDDEEPTPC